MPYNTGNYVDCRTEGWKNLEFLETQKACVCVGVGEFSLSFKNSKEIIISMLDLFNFLNCYVQEKEKY